MNAERRARIQKMVDTLEEIKAEEEQYRDAIPENMQGGERY